MSRLRDDERGFTLVEMLVTLAVGMVVMFAILGLLDMTLRSSASSLGRTDAVRQGRGAIDSVGQELRLASCPDTGPAVLSATDDSVSYYVSRPQSDYRLEPVVERHTLTYDAAKGTVTLTVAPNPSGAVPPVWGATNRTSVLGTGLSREGTTPVFQYLSYDEPDASDASYIAAPVAAASLSSIAQVQVTFTALGASPNKDQGSSRFQSTIVLRTDDPSDEDNSPEC
jgi:prepilin-type N-terminal cleavage/methylation domain-containing protein